MALLNKIIFFTIIQSSFSQTLKDEGILPSCSLEVFDIFISSSSTDQLQLALVLPEGKFEVYDISKASQVIKSKRFRRDFRTVLYVHGFYDNYDSDFSKNFYNQYILRGRYNILTLNSSSLLKNILYPRGARMTKYIGGRLGTLLSQLKKTNLNMDTLDLIGHSLGAHILGFAGKTYFKNTGSKLYNIIALDPAGPCFREAEVKNRLDKTDATFVQVIHTNGGWFGIFKPIGHVDFYINGGKKQPSDKKFLPCNNICSHGRALEIWSAAVSYPSGFIAVKCRSLKEVNDNNCYGQSPRTALMGPAAEVRARGIYYVNTISTYPYYLGNEGTFPPYYSNYRPIPFFYMCG